MDRRQLVMGLSATWVPVALDWLPKDGLLLAMHRKESQESTVARDELIRTPPIAGDLGSFSLSLSLITYKPTESLEIRGPGPVACYIESGSLSIEYVPGAGTALLYSGPDNSPPALDAADGGLTVVPSGYAVLAESGEIGITRNDNEFDVVVLAVALIPDAGSGSSSSSPDVATPWFVDRECKQ